MTPAIVAFAAMTAALGACSGDGEPTETTTVPVTTSVVTTTATTAPATTTEPPVIPTVPEDNSVLGLIRLRPDLTRFTELADAIGDAAPFQQARGVTLLAPTDDAFAAAYDDAAWAALLADVDAVTFVLSEHLSIGGQTLADLIAAGRFENASAQELPVVAGPPVGIGPATVVEGDLTADNGIVHVIDAVIPPGGP